MCCVSSYLLGLLAKIKCSISSSQPDLWDLEYISSIIWLGTIYEAIWSQLVVDDPFCGSPLCPACRQTLCASKRDLGIAVSPRVAGTPCYVPSFILIRWPLDHVFYQRHPMANYETYAMVTRSQSSCFESESVMQRVICLLQNSEQSIFGAHGKFHKSHKQRTTVP